MESEKKRFFTALSRLLHSFAFFGFSIKYLFSREYWADLRADHVPETLHFVMKDYDRKNRYKELDLNSGS